MSSIAWSEEKNEWLKRHRGIGFDQVAALIERGRILEIVDHPNQSMYPGQKVAILEIDEYVFLVPYEVHEDETVLKTIIPSRKMTRKYLGKR